MGQVTRPVEQTVGLNMIAVFIFTTVDVSCNTWQTGQQYDAVIKYRQPVIFFTDPFPVFFLEITFCLQGHHTYDKHRHRVCRDRQRINSLKHVRGNVTPALKNIGHMFCILIGREFPDQHQVKKALR